MNTARLNRTMTPSLHQRGLVAAASLVITLAMLAGNLGLAQRYAQADHGGVRSAQAGQSVRS